MKKKNIVLLGVVLVLTVICFLGVVIGFGVNDDDRKEKRTTVNISKDLLKGDKDEESTSSKKEKETKDKESVEESSKEEATENETTEEETTTDETTVEETTEAETTTEVETTTVEETTTRESTTAVEATTESVTQPFDRYSYNYMILDGKSVYQEYNGKLMELYNCINAERTEAGMPSLTFDTDISYIACARASQIAYTDALGENGEIKYYDLMNQSGLRFTLAVENTAAGHELAKEVVSGGDTSWKTSQSHYDNMISSKYTRVGVGVDYSDTMGYIWVAIFSN